MVQLEWRGNQYEFEHKTRGKLTEKITNKSTIDAPIWGSDTESVLTGDRYEVQCIQLSGAVFGEHLEWLGHKDSAIQLFCRLVIRAWTAEDEPAQAICYFHNLEYDWLQLVKDNEKLLAMAKVGVSPDAETVLFSIGNWRVTLDKNCIFSGSAPAIRLKFRLFTDQKRKGGKTFVLSLFDTWSYFPGTLESLGKDLGLSEQKEERQADIGLRDYRIEGDCQDKRDFEHYAKQDALVTRLAGEKIRELHKLHGLTKIRPSAPSYAIAVLYADLPDGVKIQNASYEDRHIQIALDAYRGGRTGGIYHGAVSNLWVLDFHSSYPASMTSLPSFSPEMAYVDIEDLSLDYVMDLLSETGNAFLRVSGRETNADYPSLLTTIGGKLCPVYGEFHNIATTGYEFYAGVKSGGLVDVVIHECIILFDIEENPYLPFKEYAEKGYQEKSSNAKGSMLYIAAKLKLNASYGKLIESRAQKLIGLTENNLMFPYLAGMEKDFSNYYYQEYLSFLDQTEKDEIDWYMDIVENTISEFDEPEESWLYQALNDFNIGGYVYGQYAIPAAASLITGCSRARLLCAMKATGAIYWDTDSIFIENGSREQIEKDLAKTADWLPDNAIPIRIGEALGEMDIEMEAGRGWLAGTKRYYLKSDKEDKPKMATHGVPALDKKEARDLIKALATGQDYSYTSRAKPTKAKEARRVDDIGRFQSKDYLPKFRLDTRLNWTATESGWRGTVVNYSDLLQHEKKQEQEQRERRDKYINKLL